MPLNKIQQQMLEQQVQDKLNAVGNKASLQTTNKTDLVSAINENTTQLAEKVSQTDLNSSVMAKVIGKLAKGESVTIVFLGDSTTEANTANNNNPHPNQLKTYLQGKYGADKVTVINSGVSGNTIEQMLDRTYSGVVKHKPDLVFISSGFNDIGNSLTQQDFEFYYKCIIDEIFATNGEDTGIILRTQNLQTDPNSTTMQAFETWLNPSVEKIARAYSIGYLDFYSYEKAMYQKGEINLNTIMYDYTHPNEQGQQLITDFIKPLFEAKKNTLSNSRDYKYTYLGVGNTLIDNSVSGLIINNNDIYPNGSAYGVDGLSGKQQTVKFYGTAIGIQYTQGENYGIAEITIDGVAYPDLDMYAPISRRNYHCIKWITGLNLGEHVLVIKNKATSNPSSSGVSMYIGGYLVRNANNTKTSFNADKYHYSTVSIKNYCEVSKTSAQALTTTVSKLLFDKKIYDNNSMFDTANNRIAVKKAGIYSINLNLTAEPLASASVQVEIRINGLTAYFDVKDTATTRATAFSAVLNKNLNINDYVEVWVKQTTGNALNIYANGYSPFLSLTEL